MKILDMSYRPPDCRSGGWVDLSRKGNHGTPYGGARPYMIAPGIYGYEFDGSTGHINCGKDSSLKVTDTITVGAWVYPILPFQYNLGGVVRGISRIDDSRILITSDNRVLCQVYIDGTRQSLYGDGITYNKFNNIVYVYDGSQEIIYVNGKESNSLPKTGEIDVGIKPLIIGWGYVEASYFHFNGLIAQFIIENRDWQPDEVRENYYRSPIYRMLRGLPHSQVYIRVPWKQIQRGIYV